MACPKSHHGSVPDLLHQQRTVKSSGYGSTSPLKMFQPNSGATARKFNSLGRRLRRRHKTDGKAKANEPQDGMTESFGIKTQFYNSKGYVDLFYRGLHISQFFVDNFTFGTEHGR